MSGYWDTTSGEYVRSKTRMIDLKKNGIELLDSNLLSCWQVSNSNLRTTAGNFIEDGSCLRNAYNVLSYDEIDLLDGEKDSCLY